MRFMFDTNVFDHVVEVSNLPEQLNTLSQSGALQILTTHIQEDELASINNAFKRNAIANIKRRCVTTSGAVCDVSKFDMATFGDGGETGCSIGQIDSDGHNHTADALIARTASRDAEVLVTRDERLSKRIKKTESKCEIWRPDNFIAFARKAFKDLEKKACC